MFMKLSTAQAGGGLFKTGRQATIFTLPLRAGTPTLPYPTSLVPYSSNSSNSSTRMRGARTSTFFQRSAQWDASSSLLSSLELSDTTIYEP